MSEYSPSWHDPQRLAAELSALPALDNGSVERAQGDFLIDAHVPDAPLLISFAFVDWNKPAEFYLYGRSKKLETLSGRPMNRILLRDRHNLWYLKGVQGLGGNVAEVVQKLTLLIAAIQPSAVWCIGESMGGYAAILHGLLLHADRIVAFGALSCFNPDFAQRYGDRRWLAPMQSIEPALAQASDLPALARRRQYHGQLHLIQGTSGSASGSVNLDVMHSRRYADLSCVRYHDYPEADHMVTAWLNAQQQFDGILLHCLFDAPAPMSHPLSLASKVRKATHTNAPWLRRWPESFAPLNDEMAAQTEEDVLVHHITPRAPLVICFADAAPGGRARFHYYTECAQLNAGGQIFNLVLLRDSRQCAWLAGCVGMGDNADSVAANLRKLITLSDARRVICIGQGVGGFAALLFAAMIGAEATLAFDPPTVLDVDLAARWHDMRHTHILNNLADQGEPRDLLPVLRRYRGQAYLYCSALAFGSPDAGSHSAVHAERVAMLPNVSVTALPTTRQNDEQARLSHSLPRLAALLT